MSRRPDINIDNPYLALMAAFWRTVLDDLHGRGVTYDNPTNGSRNLPYEERVRLEREEHRQAALRFLYSPDFDYWANQCALTPDTLREMLLAEDA